MLSYILPFALYLLFIQFSDLFADYYPFYYTVCVVVVGAVTYFFFRGKSVVKTHCHVASGVLFGGVGIITWIFICRLQLEQSILQHLPAWLAPEARASFNPFESIKNPAAQWGFVGVRILGLAVLVPIIEEVFWRGFLMRWIISPDWQNQKIGVFSVKSFFWVTLLFTLAHPEWFAAAIYCMLLNILLYWKRDIWNCIVAHGTSNFLLGVYIISTGTWELW